MAGVGRVVGQLAPLLPIRRVVFVRRAGIGIRRGRVWRGCCMCCSRTPLAGGAVSGAGVAERRDVSASVGGVVAAGPVGRRDRRLAGAACWREPARLVAGDRRRLSGRREKGGEKVARSLLGRPGSRYHLAVDANGLPLEVRLAAGNENEQRHLLPLIDALIERGIRPAEVWADRGYDSGPLA